jgi:hypothetical protein
LNDTPLLTKYLVFLAYIFVFKIEKKSLPWKKWKIKKCIYDKKGRIVLSFIGPPNATTISNKAVAYN